MLDRFYALREKYLQEKLMAEAKVEVVNDLIKEFSIENTEEETNTPIGEYEEQPEIFEEVITDGTN